MGMRTLETSGGFINAPGMGEAISGDEEQDTVRRC
jgi:hypothetical protein